MSQNGKHVPLHERSNRRHRTVAAVAVLAIVVFAAGYLLARDLTSADPTVDAPPTTTPSTPTPSASPSKVPPTPSAAVADGQHFVQPTGVSRLEDGTDELRFDLATFYTGADAFEYAEQEGIELEQEFLIVDDDGGEILTMPLAADVTIEYIPAGTCCELQPGNLDALAESVNGGEQTDYPDPEATWWWATVEDGVVTGLVQQYLA